MEASQPEAIDSVMKLGLNHPMGPLRSPIHRLDVASRS